MPERQLRASGLQRGYFRERQLGGTMRLFVLVVVALASQAARANLLTAQAAYKDGDYQAAAREYRTMAELGNPIAQYDLASLYANGQGVNRSELNAYAWASLAAAGGYLPAKGRADKLRPSLAPGSEAVARAPYLLDQLKHEQDGNPRALEIRAAAQAASGAYADAAASQGRAITQAKHLGWDLGPLNERQVHYQAGQPWYGNLLIL